MKRDGARGAQRLPSVMGCLSRRTGRHGRVWEREKLGMNDYDKAYKVWVR